ncbi:MAG TPA: helix-turn-helix domain-containing protein, partial [bacterium]|nr:helix-turn-helix domain-containing protein [bacterium]
IAATNKNLEELVKRGVFRQDLYYRLNVYPIYVAPLRERKEDIPELVYYFVDKYSKLTNKHITKVEEEIIEIFQDYEWYGNIRELENIIERMIVITSDDNILRAAIAPQEIRAKKFKSSLNVFDTELTEQANTLPELLSAIEKKIILETYQKEKYHQTKTAEKLGISRTDLQYKLKKYNIQK